MEGGELLGCTARPSLMKPGDIVTADDSGDTLLYWFDPDRLVEGNHWVRAAHGGGWDLV